MPQGAGNNGWLVFGGFGMLPEVLRPVFGDNSTYVNVNELFSQLVRAGQLRDGWERHLCRILEATRPDWEGMPIAGWSTGAIMAFAASTRRPPERLLLLAPTPSFCRRPDFKHGTRSSVLNAMMDSLRQDKESALERFGTRSGFSRSDPIDWNRPVASLIDGLIFLQQASLLPVTKVSFPLSVVHGKADSIVPPAAGRFLCEKAGGIFVERPGNHAFFMQDAAFLKGLLTKRCHPDAERSRGDRMETSGVEADDI